MLHSSQLLILFLVQWTEKLRLLKRSLLQQPLPYNRTICQACRASTDVHTGISRSSGLWERRHRSGHFASWGGYTHCADGFQWVVDSTKVSGVWCSACVRHRALQALVWSASHGLSVHLWWLPIPSITWKNLVHIIPGCIALRKFHVLSMNIAQQWRQRCISTWGNTHKVFPVQNVDIIFPHYQICCAMSTSMIREICLNAQAVM